MGDFLLRAGCECCTAWVARVDARKRMSARRRWIYTLLFVLCASASMVGPTQALSGLISRSLNAIYTVVDSVGSGADSSVDSAVAEPKAAVGGSFPFAASRDNGVIPVDLREASSDEWALPSGAPLLSATPQQSQRDTSSSASGGSSSTVSGGQSFSSGGAMPGRIPVPLALLSDAPSGVITLDELQGMGLMQEFGPEALLLDTSSPPHYRIHAYHDDALDAADGSWALPPWSPMPIDPPLIAPSPSSASAATPGATPPLNPVIADTLSPPFAEGTGGGLPDASDALPLASSVLPILHRNDSSAEKSERYARENDETQPAAVPETTPYLLLATGAAACIHRAHWRKRQPLSRASGLDRLPD